MKNGGTDENKRLRIIGQRCIELRNREDVKKRRKVSQRDFAKMLDIPYSAISVIESGKRKMTMKELCAYQNKCGVSFDYLMGEDVSPTIEENMRVVEKTTGLEKEGIETIIKKHKSNKNDMHVINSFLKSLDFSIFVDSVVACMKITDSRLRCGSSGDFDFLDDEVKKEVDQLVKERVGDDARVISGEQMRKIYMQDIYNCMDIFTSNMTGKIINGIFTLSKNEDGEYNDEE